MSSTSSPAAPAASSSTFDASLLIPINTFSKFLLDFDALKKQLTIYENTVPDCVIEALRRLQAEENLLSDFTRRVNDDYFELSRDLSDFEFRLKFCEEKLQKLLEKEVL